MSSLVTQHPEEALLLRYIDGELPGRKCRQIENHLKACWQCRTELEELEDTVAGCVRYRKNVLQAYLPDPPKPWPDLYREFARIDSSASGESQSVVKQLAARFRGTWERATVRWGAIGAVAALVMVGVVWNQFRETPSVQAAVLLKKAVLAADARTTPARRVIQIRTRSQKLTRTLGVRSEQSSLALAPIQARLEKAHYNWEDPLSAKAFLAWREAVPVKRDEVIQAADSYRIHTESEGELVSASLVLRASDLRPVEERLEFRDEEWVEFTDITDATTRDDGVSVATNVEPPVRPAVPSRPAATLSGPASISDELQVLAALRGIGADLGDPVEVKLSQGLVLVTGVGISPDRQRQIHDLLDGKPNVKVQFSDPVGGVATGEPATSDVAGSGVTVAGFQARVEKQLGGHAEFEKFSASILDQNDALMARAYALRRLAERFSVAREAELTVSEREVLRDMARQHTEALASEVGGIERVVRPVLLAMGGSAGSRKAAFVAWQPATEELFHASHRLEVLVSVLLGVTPGSAATERLPNDLLAAMAELRANLNACTRLLGQ